MSTEEAIQESWLGCQQTGHDTPCCVGSPGALRWRAMTSVAGIYQTLVKSLPAAQETWARSLGQEDPLEEEMATHSITLAWRIPWREEPGGLP